MFYIGDSEVTLDATSTTVATSLGSSNLNSGVEFLAASINYLLENDAPGYTDDDVDDTIDSMVAWLEAVDGLNELEVDATASESASVSYVSSASSITKYMAQLIVNWGDLAALTSSGRSCDSASTYGSGTQCEDLEDIGLSGYLGLYNNSINLSNKNDPKNTQPLSPEDFKLVLKEDGALAAFYNALLNQRYYTFDDVYDLLINDLGITFFTEDREGNISYDDVPTAEQMKTYLQTVAAEILQAVRDDYTCLLYTSDAADES